MHVPNRNRIARRPHAALGWLAALAAAALLAVAGCAPAGIEGPAGPLRAPRITRAAASDGALDLYLVPSSKADSYTVYWSAKPGLTRSNGTKVEGVGPVFHHTGLTNGTIYYYLVTAVSGGKESPDAATGFAMPVKESVRNFPTFTSVLVQGVDTFKSLAETYLKDGAKGGIIQDFNGLDKLVPFQAVAIPKEPYRLGGITPSSYQTVPVLTYHQFSSDKSNKMTVPFQQFDQEMKYLKDNGYHVVPLADFVKFINVKGQLPEKSVVITVDDGWMSFYDYGYPILKKYGYPSTLFVYTDFPESDPLALTWKQVQEMSKNGVDIQCHTKTHRNLKMEKGEELGAYVAALRQEFEVCKKVLKEKLGVDSKFLAYPYGANNHLVVAMARAEGFEAAFTVHRHTNAFYVADYLVNRSMIYGGASEKEFLKNLQNSDTKFLK